MGPGKRNRRIFDFARELRGRFAPATDPTTLRWCVERWFEAAVDVIRTKNFATTSHDFLVAWENIERPVGATLQVIKDRVAADEFTLGTGDIKLD